MNTIYHCLAVDKRYIPPRRTVMYQALTEKEAIEWLENNGGGVYRNTLANFEMKVEKRPMGGEG